MSEHVCDWMIKENPRSPLPMIVCTHPKCHGRLLIEEAEAMLNEHAALKRENEQFRAAFDAAAERIATGRKKQLDFKCSHCGKDTPLLIDALLVGTQERE